MFLRHTTRKKNGKVHRYFSVVENRRIGQPHDYDLRWPGHLRQRDSSTGTIAAAYDKRRREDTLPLRPGTAALIKQHLAGKMPSAQAFRVPPRQHVAKMLRANLAEARRVWLESHKTPQEREKAETTTSLAYADGASRVADFYALRHSFISALVAGGIHPKTAQRLARRSTIGLTMDRYTHMQSTGLASALDVLPDLSQSARQVATGPIMRCWLTVIILPNPRCVS